MCRWGRVGVVRTGGRHREIRCSALIDRAEHSSVLHQLVSLSYLAQPSDCVGAIAFESHQCSCSLQLESTSPTFRRCRVTTSLLSHSSARSQHCRLFGDVHFLTSPLMLTLGSPPYGSLSTPGPISLNAIGSSPATLKSPKPSRMSSWS